MKASRRIGPKGARGDNKRRLVTERLSLVRQVCQNLVNAGVEPTHALVEQGTLDLGHRVARKTLERDPYKTIIASYRRAESAASANEEGEIEVLKDNIRFLQEEIKRLDAQNRHLRSLLVSRGIRQDGGF